MKKGVELMICSFFLFFFFPVFFFFKYILYIIFWFIGLGPYLGRLQVAAERLSLHLALCRAALAMRYQKQASFLPCHTHTHTHTLLNFLNQKRSSKSYLEL